MKFSKVIYVDRGAAEVSALVSADITLTDSRQMVVRNFQSDYPLRDAEIERASIELIDRAQTYPDAGFDDRPSFPRFADSE